MYKQIAWDTIRFFLALQPMRNKLPEPQGHFTSFKKYLFMVFLCPQLHIVVTQSKRFARSVLCVCARQWRLVEKSKSLRTKGRNILD